MSANNALDRAKKLREVDFLQQHNVAETLEKISKFLQEHEASSVNDCTHTVFDNYQDWWAGQNSTFKLAIAEDNTLDMLYRYIAILYDLGIPLTLAEKRTPVIGFVQDIEILGNKNASITVTDLLGPEAPFARLLGKTLGELFPKSELVAFIFDSSGQSRTYGVMKTSLRVVWPSIVVDKERAERIRDYVVHRFKESQDEHIRAIGTEIQQLNKANVWSAVFSDSIYFGRYGVRMPLCDRVSPAPLKKPEGRPFRPFGAVRFNFAESSLATVEKRVEPAQMSSFEWLKHGVCRRDAGKPLTEWVAPTWRGERSVASTMSSATAAATARSPGHVKPPRSRGGSDGPGRPARPRGQPIEKERVDTVEREFDGTAQEFGERLEQRLGRSWQHLTVEDGRVEWTGDSGARIEFKESNRRVYIIGKVHQIHSLLDVVAPFLQQVGEFARSVTHTNASNNGGGTAYAPRTAYAPSAGYIPSAIYAPRQAYAASSMSVFNSTREGGLESTKRVACRDFVSEASGELSLSVGDHITVMSDPYEAQRDLHRWIYGRNEASEERGWFLLSCTSAVQIQEGIAAEQ